jgi:hypothetical protein
MISNATECWFKIGKSRRQVKLYWRRWEENVTICREEILCEGEDRIRLSYGTYQWQAIVRNQWRAVVNKVMNRSVPCKQGNCSLMGKGEIQIFLDIAYRPSLMTSFVLCWPLSQRTPIHSKFLQENSVICNAVFSLSCISGTFIYHKYYPKLKLVLLYIFHNSSSHKWKANDDLQSCIIKQF